MAALAADAAVVSGTLWARVSERAVVLGEAAAARRREALARELAGLPDVAAAVEGEAVVLSGRGLAARLADEARLRFAGRIGR